MRRLATQAERDWHARDFEPARHNLAGGFEFVVDIGQQQGNLEILAAEDLFPQIAARRAVFGDDDLADGRFSLLEHSVERFADRCGRHHPHIARLGVGDFGACELSFGLRSERQGHGGSHDCGPHSHRDPLC